MNKKISVVIATLNSERTLGRCLEALRAQDYPQDCVDIMVIDGGSTDQTRAIARHHRCRIIDNPQVEPVSAKVIGMAEATGDYLLHVDSDEILLNPKALELRVRVFQDNPQVKFVVSSGYRNPQGCPFVNCYINEFGDPFSMFFYRFSKADGFQLQSLRKMLPTRKETNDYVVFDLTSAQRQPIYENAACGNAIDLHFFRQNFSHLVGERWGPVHFFYHMQSHTKVFAVTKDDPILHDSVDSLKGFLAKVRWRIKNNIFFLEQMGQAGFLGRLQFDPQARRRKYLFVPYTLTIGPVLLDSVWLAFSRRDPRYLQHFWLCWYTLALIFFYLILRLLGWSPSLRSYGEGQKINSASGLATREK